MGRRYARCVGALSLCAIAACASRSITSAPVATQPTRNVVIFVADGLRYGSVNANDAPTLLQVREQGVNFVNSHSVFPTFTTANASAIATGHYLGDTGNYTNTIYVGFPIFSSGHFGRSPGSFTPFIENDQILSDLTDHFENHNYLNEESLLALARQNGFSTAAIGKLGPVVIQDITQVGSVNGAFPVPQTVIVDDSTGSAVGVPLSTEMKEALMRAGLPTAAPPRNQPGGNVDVPGTDHANIVQQQFFVDATTKAVLPLFKQRGKPFVLLYWSRDPDGTQHNQGDSHNSLVPGINGPTSKQAVRNADANLKQILDYIHADRELANNTDIFVTSDHGFATISRRAVDAEGRATTSYAAGFTYLDRNGKPETLPGRLPAGFLAIDLAHALGLPLFDPDVQVQSDGIRQYMPVDPTVARSTATVRQRPAIGNGMIGGSGKVLSQPDCDVIVTVGGGSDLIYVLKRDGAILRRIVDFLGKQDYVDGLFVDSTFGEIPGTLPLSAIALEGTGQLPRPSIVVNFKSFSTDPNNKLMTAVQVADTSGQEGQGMHGSLGRDNTYNNMTAIGPDFKARYVDEAPVSNADLVPTLAHILGLKFPSNGQLRGRVLAEAIVGGPARTIFDKKIRWSKPIETNKATALVYQTVGDQHYFDVACFAEATQEKQAVANPCER